MNRKYLAKRYVVYNIQKINVQDTNSLKVFNMYYLFTYAHVLTNYSVWNMKYANKGGFSSDIWRTNYAPQL